MGRAVEMNRSANIYSDHDDACLERRRGRARLRSNALAN